MSTFGGKLLSEGKTRREGRVCVCVCICVCVRERERERERERQRGGLHNCLCKY